MRGINRNPHFLSRFAYHRVDPFVAGGSHRDERTLNLPPDHSLVYRAGYDLVGEVGYFPDYLGGHGLYPEALEIATFPVGDFAATENNNQPVPWLQENRRE